MKYLVAGDYHGNPRVDELEKEILNQDVDVFISLGDFDSVSAIQRMIELEKRLKKENIEIIKVPGNHDDAIFNNMTIYSGTLQSQGKTSHQLHKELFNNEKAKKYLRNLLNGRTRESLRINGFKSLIVHGALNGNISSYPGCPKDKRDLWLRLLTKEDLAKNFKAMKKQGYGLMIRGHDHNARYICWNKEGGIKTHEPRQGKNSFELRKNRFHLIDIGSFFNGCFVLIEDSKEKTTVTYKEI